MITAASLFLLFMAIVVCLTCLTALNDLITKWVNR